jgi:hypothetical protein
LFVSKGPVIQAWWDTSVILALMRLKQEDQQFNTSLGYIVRLCFVVAVIDGY